MGTCVKKDCFDKGLRCKEFDAAKLSKISTVGCLYPCHVSTSGFGKSCATCEKPAFRKVENHCTSCNSGFYLSGTTCKAYSCRPYPHSDCVTCVDQALRTTHDHCASCRPGSYISENKCHKYDCRTYPHSACATCKDQALRKSHD